MLVDNTDDKIKGPKIHPSKVIFGSTVGKVGTPVKITATAQLCRAFDFVHMCKSRNVLLLSSGKIHICPCHPEH